VTETESVMKTTKRDFREFCDECRRLQKLWGLSGWRLQLGWEELDDHRAATCSIDLEQRALYVVLGKQKDEQDLGCREWARHEMIHALLAPIGALSYQRFVQRSELYSAEHEVIEQLDRLLPR
jgi:hypothetical protein